MEEVRLRLRNLFFLSDERHVQMLNVLGQVKGQVAKRVTEILVRIGKGENVRSEDEIINTEALLKEVSDGNEANGMAHEVSQSIASLLNSLRLGKSTRWAGGRVATDLVIAGIRSGVQISGNIYANWLHSIIRNPEGMSYDELVTLEREIVPNLLSSGEYSERPEYYERLRKLAYKEFRPGESIAPHILQTPREPQRIKKVSSWKARGIILGAANFNARRAWEIVREEVEVIGFELYSVLVHVMEKDKQYRYDRKDFEEVLAAFAKLTKSESQAKFLFIKNLKRLPFLSRVIADFSSEYPWLSRLGSDEIQVKVSGNRLSRDPGMEVGSESKIYFYELLSLPESMRVKIYAKCKGGPLKSFLHGVMQGNKNRELSGQSIEVSEGGQLYNGDFDDIVSLVRAIREVRKADRGAFPLLQTLAQREGLSIEILTLGISKIQNGEVTVDELESYMNELPASVFGVDKSTQLKLDKELKRFGLSIIASSNGQTKKHTFDRSNGKDRVSYQEAVGRGLDKDLARQLSDGNLYTKIGAAGKKRSGKYGFQPQDRLPDMGGAKNIRRE